MGRRLCSSPRPMHRFGSHSRRSQSSGGQHLQLPLSFARRISPSAWLVPVLQPLDRQTLGQQLLLRRHELVTPCQQSSCIRVLHITQQAPSHRARRLCMLWFVHTTRYCYLSKCMLCRCVQISQDGQCIVQRGLARHLDVPKLEAHDLLETMPVIWAARALHGAQEASINGARRQTSPWHGRGRPRGANDKVRRPATLPVTTQCGATRVAKGCPCSRLGSSSIGTEYSPCCDVPLVSA